MKLLFPIFASLMLQTQVNTELFALKKCLKGFGKCKNHCAVSEKEIMMCKKKKCCIEPKAAQVIKNFIQSEILHTSNKDSQALFKKFKSSNVKIPTEYHISSILPQIVSISPSANTSTIVITNATTLNSITTITAASTKSDTTKSSNSAIASTPAPPPSPP
ncbi:PREDICTED: beta-defensin 129 [Chrysochloris asiatica]|uniref:Beta-defensin 129 n=1 Tax=Chrysochloris asiatica TaxID=185453 RepID=A0A9B0TI07_CHRAS|nr:PREDICTED: beta-defensin 129 [Chrysochloris asiatica]